MANPIFVIGNNRSGTHWLSNILLNHPDIAGVQHENHGGIIETEILMAFPKIFGLLDNLNSRIALIECFAATDFARVAGLTKEKLYSFSAKTYPGFLCEFMDCIADHQGKGYWLQKFSPAVLPDLIRWFPEGRFVMILRDVIPTVRSSMGRWGQGGWCRYLYGYHYGVRKILVHRRHPSAIIVRYERMKTDLEGTIQEVCRFLGVKFVPEMVKVAYRPNTSFSGSGSAESFLTPGQLRSIRLVSGLLGMMPLAIFNLWNRVHRMARARHPFNSQTFSLLRRDYNLSVPGNQTKTD
ncbi:MAG: sulfotransferase [Phycisphaerae bacterium]|nr:sulfotransferase [Phycisphaerae bacterium]